MQFFSPYIFGLAALCVSGCSGAVNTGQTAPAPQKTSPSMSVSSEIVPPARDPNAAVQEEYDAAIKAGTREALSLFIQRHPEHRLAEEARRALSKLNTK